MRIVMCGENQLNCFFQFSSLSESVFTDSLDEVFVESVRYGMITRSLRLFHLGGKVEYGERIVFT